MSCLRTLATLALLAVLVGGPARPAAAASGPPPMAIAVRAAEPAPLDLMGDPQDEELFVWADVRYWGPDLLYLNRWDFRLMNGQGASYSSQPYEGLQPLQPVDLAAPAHVGGWLLFIVPKGAANLSLLYKVPESRLKKYNATYVRTSPFTPLPNARRRYGVAAQPALDAYLFDEAVAAGYISLDVDGLYAAGHTAALPTSVRARLQQGRISLVQDHRTFDAVPAPGADAHDLKNRADGAFSAIERDLAAASAVRSAVDWAAWRATFGTHDRALADLYEVWPGLQRNVTLPSRFGNR